MHCGSGGLNEAFISSLTVMSTVVVSVHALPGFATKVTVQVPGAGYVNSGSKKLETSSFFLTIYYKYFEENNCIYNDDHINEILDTIDDKYGFLKLTTQFNPKIWEFEKNEIYETGIVPFGWLPSDVEKIRKMLKDLNLSIGENKEMTERLRRYALGTGVMDFASGNR